MMTLVPPATPSTPYNSAERREMAALNFTSPVMRMLAYRWPTVTRFSSKPGMSSSAPRTVSGDGPSSEPRCEYDTIAPWISGSTLSGIRSRAAAQVPTATSASISGVITAFTPTSPKTTMLCG